jgi:hypothetical protein
MPQFCMTWGYARSTDTREAGETGQDYLTFCSDAKSLRFALCDGVSQSFYGELAARCVGDALMDWFRERPAGGDLAARLTALTGPGTDLVRACTLPAGLPPILTRVLEQKRSIGSEAMFAAGRLDLPAPDVPDGLLSVARMGDCRLRVWEADASGYESERLGTWLGQALTEQRWSTARGLVGGGPNLHEIPLADPGQGCRITAVLLYSDGLAGLDTFATPPTPQQLADMAAQAGADPGSDDLAFLLIQLPVPGTEGGDTSSCNAS